MPPNNAIKVLVIGSGGREHALVWKIVQSPLVAQVIAAPGSDAMRDLAKVVPETKADDTDGLIDLASRESVDLVVVGPEDPLADGIVDRMQEAGLTVFGPSAAAAQLETSKGFARSFMARHGVPHPAFERFTDLEAARSFVRSKATCVVKADGLCAGKGVFVCNSSDEALAALSEIMGDRRFGEAGEAVLVEDVLLGQEASYYVITDGEKVVTLAAAQDHKRLLDGDAGENTGGMGAYAPAPVVDELTEKRVLEEVVYPTLRGMREDGMPFTGVLYIGLMIDSSGRPSVVEFNVRFGDPETQPLMLALEADLVPYLLASAHGALEGDCQLAQDKAAVTVVLASGGYPRTYPTGLAIEGLDSAGENPDVVVFHAGTKREADGTWRTAGGRVLGVTARGDSIREARDLAYVAADAIHFEGAHLRRDIAFRAL